MPMTDTLLLIDDNAVQAATRQTILKTGGIFCDCGAESGARAGAVQRRASFLTMSGW